VEPVRLRLEDLPEAEIARRAAEVLRNGGIALLPAEGVYGFHASASSAAALERILAFKGRNDRAGFIGLIARPEDASRWARLDATARELVRKHWPGALTLVLDALPLAPDVLRSANGTIALRCPGSSFLRAVIAAVPVNGIPTEPVLSTSANEPAAPAATKLVDAPVGVADLMVDGGTLSGTPSTVVRVVGSEVRVLRAGAVVLEGEA
jgi:L-threonylcarbamoyladenylate synthase